MSQLAFLITARLKSQRLPGKLLKTLGQQTVFAHVVERAKAVMPADRVVVCTSTDPKDDPLERASVELGVDCYRGSKDDVLVRLLGAARERGAETIVAMTADNPLFSIEHGRELIRLVERNTADYFVFDGLPLGTAPYAIRTSAFERIQRIKTETNTEFWPEYLVDTTLFPRLTTQVSPTYRLDARLTLDYPQDYEVFQRIFQGLTRPSLLPLREVIAYLRRHPEVTALNGNIRRSWLSPSRQDQIRRVVQNHREALLE